MATSESYMMKVPSFTLSLGQIFNHNTPSCFETAKGFKPCMDLCDLHDVVPHKMPSFYIKN